jgi:uncharacterized membrane protein (DUF2068 family)
VLRLIALERAVHVVVLSVLAVVILVLATHHDAFRHDYITVLQSLGGPSKHGFLGWFGRFFTISSEHLYEAASVVIGYAVLEAVEMVGLWLAKRWAEYLTFVATCLFLPFEVYELVHQWSVLKLVALLTNLVIAVYLLMAKRLFGARGGIRAEEERRRLEGGWAALEHATVEQPRPRPIIQA